MFPHTPTGRQVQSKNYRKAIRAKGAKGPLPTCSLSDDLPRSGACQRPTLSPKAPELWEHHHARIGGFPSRKGLRPESLSHNPGVPITIPLQQVERVEHVAHAFAIQDE